ncbi:hypothetical protein EBR16_03045, partial [bacterium]|nr:hypothetical protein [bacterium]
YVTVSAATTAALAAATVTGTPYVTVSAATTGAVSGTLTGTGYVTLTANNTGAVSGTLTGSTGAVLSAATIGTISTASGAYAAFNGNTSPAPFVLSGGTLQVYGDASLGITPGTTTVTTTAVQAALGTTIPYTGSTANWYVGMPISGANIPANSYVTAITPGTSFTINNATTTLVASGTVITGQTGAFDLAGGTLATALDITSARSFVLQSASTLAPAAGTTLTLNGVLSGAGALTKVGAGTLTLTAANTFVGATNVNQGALTLNFANVPASTNLIPATSALSLANGSTVNLVGKAATINAQTFASTAVGLGANAINLSLNSATSLALTAGAITQTTGGTLDVTLPTGTLSATNGFNTTTAATNGILGGYATANAGAGWLVPSAAGSSALTGETALPTSAAVSTTNYSVSAFTAASTGANTLGSAVVPYTGSTTGWYVGMPVTGTNVPTGATIASIQAGTSITLSAVTTAAIASGTNITVGAPTTALTASQSANAIRLTGSTAKTISGNTLTLTSGGILVDKSDTSSDTISSNLTSSTGQLSVHQYGTGVLTLSGVLSGTNAVVKSGPGALVLSGTNTFSGGLMVNAGEVRLGTGGMGAAANIITLNGGTLKANAAVTALTLAQLVGATSAGTLSLQDSAGTPVAATVTVGTGNVNNTFLGTIAGIGTLLKSGTATLTLSGLVTTANNPNLTLDSGTVNFQLAGLGNSPYAPGAPVLANFGSGALLLGNTTSSTTATALDLSNASATFGSLKVQNRGSASGTALVNTITIGAGRSLTITGNTSIGTGYNAATGNWRTDVTFAGAGTLNLGDGNARTINFGEATTETTSVATSSVVDMSALTFVNLNAGAAGSISLGLKGNQQSGALTNVILGSVQNVVTAGTVTIGAGPAGAGNANTPHSLRLGAGANLLNIDNLNLGTVDRDSGQMLFNGATGTVVLRNAAGTGAANVAIGQTAATSNTGYNATNLVDLTGHYADLSINTLAIGTAAARTSGTNNADFKFDTGVANIATLLLSQGKTAGSVVSNFTIGGGVVNIGAGGVNLGYGSNNVYANSNLNLNGGVVTIGGAIVRQAGHGLGVINVNGAVVDFTGKAVGTGQHVYLNALAGTIRNLGSLNGPAGGLTKTTATALTLEGANTFAG